MCAIRVVGGLVVWGVPSFDRGEGAEAPWMGDAMAKGALVRGNVGGANANEKVHVRAFGEEGADLGPGVVVWDGWTIGKDVVAGCEGIPAFFDIQALNFQRVDEEAEGGAQVAAICKGGVVDNGRQEGRGFLIVPHRLYDFADIVNEFGAKALDGEQIIGGGRVCANDPESNGGGSPDISVKKGIHVRG